MGDFSGGPSDSSSSSSSSTTTNTTNNNIDRRQVVTDGAVGITTDGSTINVTTETLDSGIVNKALDTIASSDAISGQGFTQLLQLASNMFAQGGKILDKTADATLAQVDNLTTLANDQKGVIDQKTIMILAGVAAVAYIGSRK